MNSNFDWLNDLIDGWDDLTAMRKATREFIARKTAIPYGNASCVALALPLLTFGLSDIPVMKNPPQMRDTMILSVSASSLAHSPIHEVQTYYLSTGGQGY